MTATGVDVGPVVTRVGGARVDDHSHKLVLPASFLIWPCLTIIRAGSYRLDLCSLVSLSGFILLVFLVESALTLHDIVESVGGEVEVRGELEVAVDLIISEGVEVEDDTLEMDH
jgi:hypothetical protein